MRALLATVALLGGLPLAAAFDVPAHPVDVILGRPTRQSVTVSVVAYQSGDGYVEVAPAAGGATVTTAVKTLPAEQGVEFLLDGLAPATAYSYRLFWRAGTSGAYTATVPRTFRTARPPGSPFTFTIHADSHLDNNTSTALFARTLANAVADAPDFHVDLGDTFMTDKYQTFTDARPQYFAQRYYLGLIGASTPVFFTLGNHDGEIGYAADGTAGSIAAWSGRLRTQLFPNPVPDSFYSGNPTPEPNVGLLQNYYAFTWGDALVVVLDPFWPTRSKGNGTDNWNWTLGAEQYVWLKSTLESSTARLKFVFIHHLVGGFGKDRRGGAEAAGLWEWGGANADGSPGFAVQRPGWAEPLHPLFVRTGVSAVFHGHDHLYVRQEMDGIVYQEVPQPGFPRPDSTQSAADYGYTTGVLYGSSGHLRVRVDGGTATVDYVRALLPADETATRHNGDVVHSYTVTGSSGSAAPAITRILGQPTDRSVTVAARADAALEIYYEYGLAPSGYAGRTGAAVMAADPNASGFWVSQTPITGLAPDTRYWYRMRYRPAGSSGAFAASAENAFHTQRPPGSSFVFCVQGDSHPERAKSMFDPDLYVQTLKAVASEQPDFYITSGDDFSVDTLATPYTQAAVTGRYTLQLPYFDIVARSAPLFLVNGNHEQASLWNYRLPADAASSNMVPVWAQNARNLYFPSPAPDDPVTGGFYTGNATSLPGIGPLRDYYAWQHGDALFVVIDPYWTSPAMVDNGLGGAGGSGKVSDRWLITHGDAQYAWLKRTLEQSTAKWKFVFAHHVMGTGRGGVDIADQYEWGGKNADGSDGFAAHRPTWPLPIHQLMAANHVTIFFQGHDHLFAHQQLDGVTYQELPNPADFTYTAFNADAYRTGDVLPNSGYVRVTVGPTAVKVDYVRQFLPEDENDAQKSGQVAFSYTIGSAAPPPPSADFSYAPAAPTAGQPVRFLEASGGAPAAWSWAFGDGGTSSVRNPVHVYAAAGSYPVSLTVTNAGGSSTATRTVSVGAPQGLALSGNRVLVVVEWQSPYGGEGGTARPLPQDDKFGFFYYADPNNPEVFVKVLDFGAGNALCFVGGLTDFYYKVTFTMRSTGQFITFEKPPYQYIGYVNASELKFAGAPGSPAGMTFVGSLPTGGAPPASGHALPDAPSDVLRPLAEAPQSLALSQGRVSVTIDWRSPYSGETGRAYGIPKADPYGFFYYTDPSNPEVFVKVLDFGTGSALVFVGGLTDFYYKVTFTVLRTGQTLVFEKPEYQYIGYANTGTLKF